MNARAAHRRDFPIFHREETAHFLDSAASSQKPQSVIDAMTDIASNHYANVHRGAYRLSLEATEIFEDTRRRVATFVGAGSDREIVMCRGATTALNMVAFGWGLEHLGPDDTILLTTMEHHANLIPWQMVSRRTGSRLDHVGMTDDFRFDLHDFRRRLDQGVRVVGVTGMSNVLGTKPPLETIIEEAHEVGAIVVVDGAQLVPHSPVDLQALDADFVAVSAHKMLGPTGIGFLWGKPERLEEMEPVEGGGEMIADVGLHNATWAPIPHRFEAGTPPIIEAAGLRAAIDYLETVGMQNVQDHDRKLTDRALSLMAEVPGLLANSPAQWGVQQAAAGAGSWSGEGRRHRG